MCHTRREPPRSVTVTHGHNALGLGATGGIEPGDDPYRLIRRKVSGGHYDRVVLLQHDEQPWLVRLLHWDVAARLRRSLDVPVQTIGQADFAPPDS